MSAPQKTSKDVQESHWNPQKLANFAATRTGLGGRAWSADTETVKARTTDTVPGGARIISDDRGELAGWSLLFPPRPVTPSELRTEIVVAPEADRKLITRAVEDVIDAAQQHRPGHSDDSLLLVTGEDSDGLISALRDAGFARERRFAVERLPLEKVEPQDTTRGSARLRKEIAASAADHQLQILDWNDVLREGLGEAVRSLQHATFLEHWGHLSKEPDEWDPYLTGTEFAPEFSGAAVDANTGEVVGYTLGAVERVVTLAGTERSAHTEYIGVAGGQRRRGIASTLLRAVWAEALDRGYEAATLGVDVENSSNARHLYESLGYETIGYHVAYRLLLD